MKTTYTQWGKKEVQRNNRGNIFTYACYVPEVRETSDNLELDELVRLCNELLLFDGVFEEVNTIED